MTRPASSPPRYGWWVAGAAATSVLLRLPSLHAPLGPDEAGALVVARAWQSGARLYVDAFVDRPQGVVLLFQRWDAWFGPSPAAVRSLAIVAGVVVVVATAVAAAAVARRRSAGAVAAWLVAVTSASAAIEGPTANGELLAGAVAVPAMAIAALVVTRRARASWLVVAGALAATAITMKQSGADVLVAITAWIAVGVWRGWRTRREGVAMAARVALGAAVVLGAAAWHGATLGWDAYAYAMVGFRLHARSALAGPSAGRLALAVLLAAVLLGPALVLAVRHLRSTEGPMRRHLRPEHVLVLLWAAAASAAFLTGGNYHRHYVVQLSFPLAVVLAVALTSGPDPGARHVLRTTAVAVAAPLAISLILLARPGWERDPRVEADVAIARWYRAHRPAVDADLLPVCASATWYVEADAVPRTPYLWVDHVRSARGAAAGLVALVSGPDRPTYLALHQPPERCDPSGALARAIERHYRRVATVDGVAILQAVPGP